MLIAFEINLLKIYSHVNIGPHSFFGCNNSISAMDEDLEDFFFFCEALIKVNIPMFAMVRFAQHFTLFCPKIRWGDKFSQNVSALALKVWEV